MEKQESPFRHVFIDGGVYWGTITKPPAGRSKEVVEKQLKELIGARTLTLLRPDGEGYDSDGTGNWLDRVPSSFR